MAQVKMDGVRKRKKNRRKGYFHPSLLEALKMKKRMARAKSSGMYLDRESEGFARLMRAAKNAKPDNGTSLTNMTEDEFISFMFKRSPNA